MPWKHRAQWTSAWYLPVCVSIPHGRVMIPGNWGGNRGGAARTHTTPRACPAQTTRTARTTISRGSSSGSAQPASAAHRRRRLSHAPRRTWPRHARRGHRQREEQWMSRGARGPGAWSKCRHTARSSPGLPQSAAQELAAPPLSLRSRRPGRCWTNKSHATCRLCAWCAIRVKVLV